MTKRKPATRARNAVKSGKPKRAADRIRESARDLFYREGIRAVGVDEIVSRAGVTKPSLYRSFPSKNDLAADYLRSMGEEGLARFDAIIAANPKEPQRQFHVWLDELLEKATKPNYRGCGSTNAAVEYPDRSHPARKTAVEIKHRFRAKLTALASAMGATDPGELGDSLQLLLEGVYASGQLFGAGGPARVVSKTVDILIAAALRARS